MAERLSDAATATLAGIAPAELAEALEAHVAERGARLSDAEIQRIFTAAFQLYHQRAESTGLGDPFTEVNGVTATQVVEVALALLHAENLEIFELALWQSWGGAPWIRNSGGQQ